MAQEGQREKAVCNRRTEWTGRCLSGVDVDPLWIVRDVGEAVDSFLIDDKPLRRTRFLPYVLTQLRRRNNFHVDLHVPVPDSLRELGRPLFTVVVFMAESR